MKALLSIKPEFVEKIFSGKKVFEFRKVGFSRDVEKVVVYATAPIGRIVGEFNVAKILEDTPASLWEKTKEHSGITEDFFFSYFKNRKMAIAIEIDHPIRYEKPINPYEKNLKFNPPQSFRYIYEQESPHYTLH